ncbi:cyanidin 3-O-glucoside 7-O-glucosyltransferase (acyl-glucose)-like isoform X2 [Thrips palmi]|uniref:Cyanidin 3-O-glucoside 7-O-glucosyltransferase (Acyl-glucose)-like isoform X2 n=1 Tax=Thrips palmi TaxID=161013 RepID=A0A6P8ZMH7_THRPL|nr:cyanidin 3-O-glucoside 7-O-glucosyltransferase (acyl-glucose)-like isoform X2 [Thrips palmi]
MNSAVLVVALLWLGAARAGLVLSDDEKYKLPPNFLFGAGTSAVQTEGAWDKDGKGENVFDHYYHTHNVPTNESADIACDFYGRYKEDIALASKVGFNVFRLSFSWARFFPDGDMSRPVNALGVQHYHNVLDELRKHNIEPLVTIFHFEYPQALEDAFGGWASEKMVDVYVEYAEFLFKEYGSKVKYWTSINEGALYCSLLADFIIPPKTMNTAEQQNACLKNTIIAHAKAHKIYHEKYKAKFNGLVGYGAGPPFSRGATPEDDAYAAYSNVNIGIGLSVDPLVFGDYPEAVRASKKPFTDEEKELIKGRIDYVGINMFGGRIESTSGDIDNGDDNFGSTNYLRELIAGINENGTNVIGYTLWSFIDTLEFRDGYSKTGLVHVDFTSPTLDRTLKDSWTFFKRVAKTRVVPLVEVGSQPFPDDDAHSSSTRFRSPAVWAMPALLLSLWI